MEETGIEDGTVVTWDDERDIDGVHLRRCLKITFTDSLLTCPSGDTQKPVDRRPPPAVK